MVQNLNAAKEINQFKIFIMPLNHEYFLINLLI